MYNQQQGNSSMTTRGQMDSSLNRVNKIFAMLRITYPTFLKNENETETKRLWFSHLESFSEDKIDAALKIMPDEFPKFAPTVGEFKKLCRGQASAGQKPPQGLPICPKCRSYTITQRHHDVCETGSVQPEVFPRVEPGEARKALAELLGW